MNNDGIIRERKLAIIDGIITELEDCKPLKRLADGNYHTPKPVPAPDPGLALYMAVTGRPASASFTHRQWLEEFAITGLDYAKEQMEARVTLHQHDYLLDGPREFLAPAVPATKQHRITKVWRTTAWLRALTLVVITYAITYAIALALI